MRNIISLLMTAALVLTTMACCSDDSEDTPQPVHTTRTVMVYMSGENNLTNINGWHFLQEDINEMIEGSKKLGDDQRLLVYVDSTNGSKICQPYIMEIHGGKTTLLRRYESEKYACDPAVFREAIEWMMSQAKADSYGLVLWGHGTGWVIDPDTIPSAAASRKRAYGYDYGRKSDGTINGRWMNITQMAVALKGLPKLAYIFADCCEMMCAEVGYELKDVTSYLIGSPAEIPGDGAPYHLILPELYKDGSLLYKGIIDTYYNYYIDAYEWDPDLDGYSVPLSVIDTRYISELALKTHDVLEQTKTPYPTCPQEPDLEKDSIVFYFHSNPMMYDMRAFVKTYATASAFEAWEAVYKQAVPYYRMSMEWMTDYSISCLPKYFKRFKKDASLNGCVSMFIPRNDSYHYTGDGKYNVTSKQMGWNRVMDWGRFGW